MLRPSEDDVTKHRKQNYKNNLFHFCFEIQTDRPTVRQTANRFLFFVDNNLTVVAAVVAAVVVVVPLTAAAVALTEADVVVVTSSVRRADRIDKTHAKGQSLWYLSVRQSVGQLD